MFFDLQLFATKVIMDAVYSGSDKTFTLGGNSAKETYEYSGAFNTTSTTRAGFSLTGNGVSLKGGTAGNIFNLHVTGTSIAKDSTGTLDFDEFYVTQNVTDFGFNIDKDNLKVIDLGSNAAVVTVTSAASNVSLNAVGNSVLGAQALVINSTKETTIDATQDSAIANGSYLTVKNNSQTVNLSGGTSLSAINIAATKSSDISFNVADGETAAVLNLAAGTTGGKIEFEGQATLSSALDNVSGVEVDLGENKGPITFTKVTSSDLSIKSAIKDANITISDADAASNILITATSDATLAFSGKGVETLAVSYLTKSAISVDNWKLSVGDSETKANAIDMGSFSMQSVKGAFAGDKLTLDVGNSKIIINSDESGKTISNVAGVSLKSNDTAYDALIVGGGSLSSKQGLNLEGFEAFLGTEENNTLDLGDVTDKKVVYLNNKIGGDSWGEWAIYNNITNVKTSSAGNSLLISDMVDKETSLYGAGAGDSLFGGVGGTYDEDMEDSLGSAQGKRGWFGSSNYSGHDVIIIRDANNTATNNFDYADAVASDQEADVLALMFGAGYIEFDSGSKGTSASLNFKIGSDEKNYMEFRNIGNANNANNYHDFFYTYDLGANTYKARVDLTNDNTTGTIGFSEDIEFYLGQGDTKLTLSADISNESLNFAGGGVMLGVKEIDGSNGGINNMLNGQNNFEQQVTASTRYATSICGGYGDGFTDDGDDTLVGGKNTTFFVGAKMGDDKIENVDTGDTVVFLGSKYADVTDLTNDNDRLTVNFDSSSGGAKIRMDAADTTSYSKITSLTFVFDDATLTWNGSTWTQK